MPFVHRVLIVCLVASPLFHLPAANAQTTADIKIMSFNIRQDNGDIGNRASGNGWYPLLGNNGGRKDRALSVISNYNPDLLGVEEMLPNQYADLAGSTALAGYGYFGQGRNGGDVGERCGIFYKLSRFTELNEGEFWLSTTPTIPGTTFVGNGSDTGNPRMANWMILQDNQSHQSYFILNTHWSLDSLAELQSANLIRQQIKLLAGDLPLIVMGDFNSTLANSSLKTLIGTNDPIGFQLKDSFRAVYPTVGANEATYHNFTGSTSGSAIDHIFFSPNDFNATAAEIVHTVFANNKYPSDHFPITTTLRVAVVPEVSTVVMVGIIVMTLIMTKCHRTRLTG